MQAHIKYPYFQVYLYPIDAKVELASVGELEQQIQKQYDERMSSLSQQILENYANTKMVIYGEQTKSEGSISLINGKVSIIESNKVPYKRKKQKALLSLKEANYLYDVEQGEYEVSYMDKYEYMLRYNLENNGYMVTVNQHYKLTDKGREGWRKYIEGCSINKVIDNFEVFLKDIDKAYANISKFKRFILCEKGLVEKRVGKWTKRQREEILEKKDEEFRYQPKWYRRTHNEPRLEHIPIEFEYSELTDKGKEWVKEKCFEYMSGTIHRSDRYWYDEERIPLYMKHVEDVGLLGTLMLNKKKLIAREAKKQFEALEAKEVK